MNESNFEEWFQSQDFYTNLRFIYGDALFLKDSDVYRVLVVRIASKAWQHQRKQVDELQARVDKAPDLIECMLARSLDNPEIQELCGQLMDLIEGDQ